ncbi:MAG: ribonuclease P protein component [Planctomycetes bacterium]|nr:ribonuclease P protein component [Planctomycetota bacterium]
MKRLFLKKSQRLCSNEQFKAVLAHKQSAVRGLFRLCVRPNGLPYPRFGVSISKNTGIPVLRNRLKRLARETFRLHQHNLPPNWDYVLIIWPKMSKKTPSADNPKPAVMSYNQFEKLFLELVEKTIGKHNNRESTSDVPQKNG